MKGLKYLLVGSVISSLWLATAHAETLEELGRSLNQTNQEISVASQQKSDLEKDIEKLKQAMQAIDRESATNEQAIETIQKDIAQLNEQIQKNEAQLQQIQTAFGQQAKAMYENGEVSFLSVLLDAKNMDDFLTRLDAFQLIAKSNATMIDQMRTLQTSITKEKQDSQNKLKSIEQKQKELATLKETKRIFRKQREAQIDELVNQITAKQEDARQLAAQIAFEKQEAENAKMHPIADDSTPMPSGITYKGSAGDIISYASQFRGVPYAWGGTTPSGFDCSGFTQYVFAKEGISLGRTARAQFEEGQSISLSDLKPGDLVFFSTYAPGASHVGIYLGYDMMINAEDNGVSISNIQNSYWGPRCIGARRILQN
jgi:peptidoglycan DL-endopeptidase CwlO